jgi:uncharacterized protein YeaO (DUF488 family)
MAIQDFKNIENINLNLDTTAQLLNSKDLNIFKTSISNVTDFGMSKNDVIEFRVYDIGNNLLEQTGGKTVNYIHKDNLPKYLKSSIDSKTQEKIFEIDVEKLVKEAGYGNGEFKVVFNFLKNYVGNENQKQKVWIHEVSPSRTEIRIQPLITNDETQNKEITRRYNAFMDSAAELRENIENIKNQIDKIELQISDLIDKYFIEKHGQKWLDVVKADYKFLNDLQYKAFKQKIFTDFKKSVFAQLDGKEFKLGSPNFNQKLTNPLDLDEFLSPTEINSLINSRLLESIEYNMVNVTYKDFPQIIKDVINQKKSLQVLQSLLDTNTISKSNLTQTQKLDNLNKNVIITGELPVAKPTEKPIVNVDPPIVEPSPGIISEPRAPILSPIINDNATSIIARAGNIRTAASTDVMGIADDALVNPTDPFGYTRNATTVIRRDRAEDTSQR